MNWDNYDFRRKLNYFTYWEWCTIYFKKGHELIDATGIKHEYVYGTPAYDTEPSDVSDPENQTPPSRVFYILCQGQSIYTKLPNGIMTDIPGINSIRATMTNTQDIGRVLLYVMPPKDWKRPEVLMMYVEPGFQSAELRGSKRSGDHTSATLPTSPFARRAEEHTAATLPPESGQSPWFARRSGDHTAATLPPESEYQSRSPLRPIQSAENTAATLPPESWVSPFKRRSSSSPRQYYLEDNENYGGKTKIKKRKRRKSIKIKRR
jgi:hypothetical protein